MEQSSLPNDAPAASDRSGPSDVAMIGLGVMGRNLTLNLTDAGYRVSVFDRDPTVLKATAADPPAEGAVRRFPDLAALCASLSVPRIVMLMVPAGLPVDAVIDELLPNLEPGDVIVDGGKGQLGMAVRELNRLGLHDLPVIGLAKQREEIFRPGESEPLVIPHDKGALRLLQRIRDEAHRFANGYHQLLMKRRVEESILDDCPGISRARKERLLERFGSVSRLRKVGAEEIATVPGIHGKLAREIVHFLKTH